MKWPDDGPLDPGFEMRPCPACATPPEQSRVLHRFPRAAYRACKRCGLVYLSPRLGPEALRALYQTESYFCGETGFGYETYEQDVAAYRRTFQRRLRGVARLKPAGRLLDVGCGPGLFVEAAVAAGYDAFGLDVSRYAVGVCAEAIRDRVRIGTLEEAGYEAASFDAITLFDVLEHLEDPRGFVRELARIARPDAAVFVATPNYASWMRRLLGSRTVSFKIPEHVAYYTLVTLQSTWAEHFRVLETFAVGQYCSMDFLAHRLHGLALPLGAIFEWVIRQMRLTAWQPYVPSGSLGAVLVRCSTT